MVESGEIDWANFNESTDIEQFLSKHLGTAYTPQNKLEDELIQKSYTQLKTDITDGVTSRQAIEKGVNLGGLYRQMASESGLSPASEDYFLRDIGNARSRKATISRRGLWGGVFTDYLVATYEKLGNMTGLWKLLIKDFYATNDSAIFSAQYHTDAPFFKELNAHYRRLKRDAGYGNLMLILRGNLHASLVSEMHPNARHAMFPHYMEVGTSAIAAAFQRAQERDPVQISPAGSGRIERWLQIAKGWVIAIGDNPSREHAASVGGV